MSGVTIAQEIAPALPGPEVSGWGEVFVSFSLQHFVTVAACAAVTGIAIGLGLTWRGTEREKMLRRVLGIGVVIAALVDDGYWMFVAPYDVGRAYPFHLCDVAMWAVAIAMLTEYRWARTLVVFLGIALSSQGFFTPTLRFGHEHIRFWLFWIGHTQIVGGALYFLIVSGYRPKWKDFAVAVVATTAWFALVFPLNIFLGTNYGYVGRTDPEHPTLVQKLGVWPWRVGVMMAMAFVAYTAVWMIGAGIEKFERQKGFTAEARRRGGEAKEEFEPQMNTDEHR